LELPMNINTLPRDTGPGWIPLEDGYEFELGNLRLSVAFLGNANEPGVELDSPIVYAGAILMLQIEHSLAGRADLHEQRLDMREAAEWLARDAQEAIYHVCYGREMSKAG
jgi:hypothetical protein